MLTQLFVPRGEHHAHSTRAKDSLNDVLPGKELAWGR
jgi:hypothetical protein